MNILINILYVLVLVTSLSFPAIAQIAQDKPELCGGTEQSVPLLPGISAVAGETFSTVFIKTNGSDAAVGIQVTMASVEEVCPISGDRLLVFGGTHTATSVVILNQKAGKLIDWFYAYDPATSPDQHWIAFRDFYPPQSQMRVSEEYVLYDLTKNKAENRLPNPDPYLDTVGRVMYPSIKNGIPFVHAALPDDQTHAFRSNAFYWSGDSRMVVFADSVQKTLSVVMVTIDSDQPHAFTHQVTAAEACEQDSNGDIQSSDLMLSHAAITSNGIELQFHSDDYGACKPVAYTLAPGDFTAAEFEVHGPPHRKDHSTMKEQ